MQLCIVVFWIVGDSSREDTAVVNSCGVRISQVGSGSLLSFIHPASPIPIIPLQSLARGKIQTFLPKNRVSINAVMGQKSSAKCTRQIFWKPLYLGHLISHALSESKIEKQKQFFAIFLLATSCVCFMQQHCSAQ